MFKRLSNILASFALAVGVLFGFGAGEASAQNPRVKLTTNLGVIVVELDAARAPRTVANFLGYVKSGFYNGTIFHRVIRGFMIQGGGMEPGLRRKQTKAAISNEADNGLTNQVGTIAMARTGDPHSATAQFFINTADNRALNHTSKSGRGWGYAVFGRVVDGMDVVRIIEGAATGSTGGFRDVPRSDIIITKAETL
jgi:cyclophilin family peptidyl-prolyl cis-trans isomerase